jgi:hypothetical protein
VIFARAGCLGLHTGVSAQEETLRLSTRLTTAAAALALAAAPAVAYAHGGHHHHGHHHKSHAGNHKNAGPIGTVASFTGGTLTITLNDGNPIAGKVTDRTIIKCETAAPQSTATPAVPPTTATPRLVRGDHGDDHHGSGDDDHPSTGVPGDNDNDHGDDNDDHPSTGVPGDDRGDEVGNGRCDATALTDGTVVEKAKISLTSQGAIWKKVVLLK